LTVIPSRREFHTLTDAGKAISYLIEEQNRGGSYAKIVTPGRIDDTSYHIFDGMQTMNPQTKGEIEIIVMHSCSGLITAFRVYRKTLSDSPLYQAIDYINDHLPGNDLINIPAIARQFYISYWTFLNQFKQLMGITIRNYIIYERLKAAHELLTTTDMPINKVAERVGYNDPVQFNKDFKHHMNYTPGSLRK
jgi:AraC-like DNA-binding protein